MVGHRDRRHAELAGAREQAVEQRRPVEHGVLGVHVQVHEVVRGAGGGAGRHGGDFRTFRGSLTVSGSGVVLTGQQRRREHATSTSGGRTSAYVSVPDPTDRTRHVGVDLRTASRSRGRGRGSRPPGRRRARSRSGPDGTVEVTRDAGQHPASLVADPAAPSGRHQAGHQVVEPLAVAAPRGRRSRPSGTTTGVPCGAASSSRSGSVVEEVARARRRGGSRRATSTALRSRSRRSSCSGQTRFCSHAIASGSGTSSGFEVDAAAPGDLGVRDRGTGSGPVARAVSSGPPLPRSSPTRRPGVVVAVGEEAQPGAGPDLDQRQRALDQRQHRRQGGEPADLVGLGRPRHDGARGPPAPARAGPGGDRRTARARARRASGRPRRRGWAGA